MQPVRFCTSCTAAAAHSSPGAPKLLQGLSEVLGPGSRYKALLLDQYGEGLPKAHYLEFCLEYTPFMNYFFVQVCCTMAKNHTRGQLLHVLQHMPKVCSSSLYQTAHAGLQAPSQSFQRWALTAAILQVREGGLKGTVKFYKCDCAGGLASPSLTSISTPACNLARKSIKDIFVPCSVSAKQCTIC